MPAALSETALCGFLLEVFNMSMHGGTGHGEGVCGINVKNAFF